MARRRQCCISTVAALFHVCLPLPVCMPYWQALLPSNAAGVWLQPWHVWGRSGAHAVLDLGVPVAHGCASIQLVLHCLAGVCNALQVLGGRNGGLWLALWPVVCTPPPAQWCVVCGVCVGGGSCGSWQAAPYGWPGAVAALSSVLHHSLVNGVPAVEVVQGGDAPQLVWWVHPAVLQRHGPDPSWAACQDSVLHQRKAWGATSYRMSGGQAVVCMCTHLRIRVYACTPAVVPRARQHVASDRSL
jgi:hypothetical protein